MLDFLQNATLSDPLLWALLIGVGLFVGFVNTVAGMATAITYSLFMAMGMPINVANGSTRVGVMAQFLVTSAIFKKKGYLDMRLGWRCGIPVGLGALLGAEFAAVLAPKVIETIMGVILPVMAMTLFIDTGRLGARSAHIFGEDGSVHIAFWKYIVFFLCGIYGGFTHAGVGLLVLFSSFFFFGIDLVQSNAIKQFAVVIYTPLALVIFILHGQVNWPVALVYSIGNIAGGVLGSYASIKGGAKLIKLFVAIAIFSMSGWLLWRNYC